MSVLVSIKKSACKKIWLHVKDGLFFTDRTKSLRPAATPKRILKVLWKGREGLFIIDLDQVGTHPSKRLNSEASSWRATKWAAGLSDTGQTVKQINELIKLINYNIKSIFLSVQVIIFRLHNINTKSTII